MCQTTNCNKKVFQFTTTNRNMASENVNLQGQMKCGLHYSKELTGDLVGTLTHPGGQVRCQVSGGMQILFPSSKRRVRSRELQI